MSVDPFHDRVRRRLARELESLAPLVDLAAGHPVAQRTRRQLTATRMGLRARLGDPDRLLDQIVAEALGQAIGPSGRQSGDR